MRVVLYALPGDKDKAQAIADLKNADSTLGHFSPISRYKAMKAAEESALKLRNVPGTARTSASSATLTVASSSRTSSVSGSSKTSGITAQRKTSKFPTLPEMQEALRTEHRAIQMLFEQTRVVATTKKGKKLFGYKIHEQTKNILMSEIGLLQSVEELVILMHAGPGHLTPDDGVGLANNQIIKSIKDGLLSQSDLARLIWGIAPYKVYFLCCEFGKMRTGFVVDDYISTDGVLNIGRQVRTCTELYAQTETVMASIGTKPLVADAFQNKKPGQLP